MKLRVVGWMDCYADFEVGYNGWAARNAVIDEIKKHGYLFSGETHQSDYYHCTPIMNDGKRYIYSQRGWGGIMAEAHGKTGLMDYASYAFGIDKKHEVRPDRSVDVEPFMPETDLSENFDIEVSREYFDSAQNKRKIKLDDLHTLRYMDKGDTLTLVCGDDRLVFDINDVDRDKDLSSDKRFKLENDMFDYAHPDKRKRAEEIFNNTKIIITVTVKKRA